MAPTSTLNFAGRDLDSNDVASTFDQPTATPSPWIDPNIPEGFSLPILLGLIALCVVGAIMVFILWRWNSVFFSDLPADHKDLITQWKTRHLKATDAASSATTSTETLVESKLAPPAPPAPAYTAAADNAAPGAEDALSHLTKANTLQNQRRTVQESGKGVRGGYRRGGGFLQFIICCSSLGLGRRLQFRIQALERKLGFLSQFITAGLFRAQYKMRVHSDKTSFLKRRRAEQWEISDPAMAQP
ncbi:hypothetical protein C8R43DRAFT_1106528 [Mycena crocata]|nr:hypothetical protein C8R43DRAFT_1106528 [Mycena crocata]